MTDKHRPSPESVAVPGTTGRDGADAFDGTPVPSQAALGGGTTPTSASLGDGHVDAAYGDELDPFADFFVTEGERQGPSDTYLGETMPVVHGVGTNIVELLAFWVADEEYAVDIVEIQEIIKLPFITEVPRVKSSILGIISLRGTIVPVLDLRVVLGLDRRSVTRFSRILVLRADGDYVGLLVDRVTSVVRFERDKLESKPRAMQRDTDELLEGVGRIGDRMVIILDVPAILNLMDSAA